MPRKKSPRKKLIEELDKLFAQVVRKRDGNTCQYCGKYSDDNRAIHVNHVIPRSQGYRYRWIPGNGICLCFKHHIGWWHKHPLAAAKWFRNKYPERYKYLSALPSEPVKYSDDDLAQIKQALENMLNGQSDTDRTEA